MVTLFGMDAMMDRRMDGRIQGLMTIPASTDSGKESHRFLSTKSNNVDSMYWYTNYMVFNLLVLDHQLICTDLTRMRGCQDSCPIHGHQLICHIPVSN